MLTKKAFNREAVLRTYWNIRRGVEVPDKELDQVDNWLKLSGVVHRQNGMLRVRNPIYERVFDEGWARDHLRLHVNWRRRLTTYRSHPPGPDRRPGDPARLLRVAAEGGGRVPGTRGRSPARRCRAARTDCRGEPRQADERSRADPEARGEAEAFEPDSGGRDRIARRGGEAGSAAGPGDAGRARPERRGRGGAERPGPRRRAAGAPGKASRPARPAHLRRAARINRRSCACSMPIRRRMRRETSRRFRACRSSRPRCRSPSRRSSPTARYQVQIEKEDINVSHGWTARRGHRLA